MDNLEPIELEILINSTEVAKQSEKVRASLKGIDGAAASTEKKFNDITNAQLRAVPATDNLTSAFKRATSAAVAYFSLNTATGFVNSLVQIRGEYQKTEIAFKTMLGSKEAADEMMRQSIDLAAKTPFEMSQISAGAKQLLAFQVPANEVIDTLRRMGDIAAGLNVPLSQLQLAFGQVKAKGKLMGDDLRQFTEAGVPMVDELAKKFSVTTGEIYAMVSAGKVGFNDVKDVLFSLTNQGGMFYNLMEEQSKSLSGQYANLKDAIEQMFNKMGQETQGALSAGMDTLTYMVEHYQELLDVLGGIITVYGSYKAGVMLLAAVEATRNKTIATEIANLTIAEKMQLGRALVTERQAKATAVATQAEVASAEALYAKMQMEVASLNVKKERLVALATEKQQLLGNAQLQLRLAQMELQTIQATGTAKQIKSAQRAVEIQQNNVIAAQEQAATTRTNALTASRAANTAQTNVGNAAKAVSIARTNAETAAEALSVATKNAATISEGKLTIAQTLRASATQLVTRAQAMLNATMLSNPIVLIIAAIGGLIYAYLQLRDTTTAAERAEQSFQKTREESKKQIDDIKNKTQELVNVINSETASKFKQLQAYKELQEMYPELYKNMDIETYKKQEAKKAQDDLNKSIDKIETQKLQEQIKAASDLIQKLEKDNEHLIQSLGRGVRDGSGIANTIEHNSELIEEQKINLEMYNAELSERLQDEKLANMSLKERKKYWEDEVRKIESSINALKKSNAQKKTGNEVLIKTKNYTVEVGNSFQNWNISPLLRQLNAARTEINNVNKAMTGKEIDKNKAFWEKQMKEAQDANDSMSGKDVGGTAWKENVKKYQEAEREMKKYDYSAKEAIATEKKAAAQSEKMATQRENAAERLREKQKDVIRDIGEAENDLHKSRMDANAREIANISDKYNKLREKAKEAKLGTSEFARIDRMEQSEKSLFNYQDGTKELVKSLEEQKEIFAAYEALKTAIGEKEAKARFGILLNEKANFNEVLTAEIDKLKSEPQNFEQGERLKALQEMQEKLAKDQKKQDDERYKEAYTAIITHQDKIMQVETRYQNLKAELSKITDEKIRAAKMEELERQKAAELGAINLEAVEREMIYQRMSVNLLGITRQQLNNRIASVKEFLAQEKFLTDEQRAHFQKELEKAESLKGLSAIDRDQQILLQDKKAAEEELTALNAKKVQLQAQGLGLSEIELQRVIELQQKLEQINLLLSEKTREQMAKVAEWANMISSSFGELSASIGDSNEGLSDTIGTIGEIAGAVGSIAGGLASGNPIQMIGGLISGISKIFAIGKKARESEKKAQEELKKRQDEIFQGQLDYNSVLRQRLITETKINDLYQSRVSAIKEEMAAHGKNKDSILRDYQAVFNRLLGLQTTIGQKTKKYGGFLGFGRKTRVVDIQQSLGSLLGVGPGAQITDDILDRLEELNAKQPLTGDAKTAYEQLKKLRDEYGSIADAQRELEKALKDAVTGTTAQSIADSIRQGVASGKKTFADFADDIEGFLRDAILAGMETDLFKEKVQGLQDELAAMMGDGIITPEERAQFQQMYLAIVDETKAQMEMLNQAGVKMGQLNGGQNSLQGAMRAASQESIDLMGGQLGGMRLAQIETRDILKAGAAQQLAATSKMIELQIDIEKNTRRTADNTEKLKDIDESNKSIDKTMKTKYNDLKAAGIIK